MSIDAFLHEIEAKLKTGQATEHTYRSAVVGTHFGASAARSPAEHPASGRDALRRVRRPAAGGCVLRTFPCRTGQPAAGGCVRRTFPCRMGLETCVSRRRVRSPHLSPAARGNQPPAGAFYAPFPAARDKAAGGCVRRTFPCRMGLETCVSRRRVRSPHLSLPHGAGNLCQP
jgi:hypothetical protein